MERTSLNDTYTAMMALVRGTVLADQNMKKKRSAELQTQEERSLKKTKMSHVTKEISAVSLKADLGEPGNDSSSKSAVTKHWRDGASYDLNLRVIALVKKPRTYVNHSYRDFSQIADHNYEKKTKLEEMTFAEKMHHVLSMEELQSCIGWMSHGRAFHIHIPKTFEKLICAEYFAMPARYSSFLRQLNNHGFKQISQGSDRNCYYHEVSDLTCDCEVLEIASDTSITSTVQSI